MKSVLVATGLCFGAIAAQASPVTFSYFEAELTGSSMATAGNGEDLGPFLPSTLGPLEMLLSFDADPLTAYLGKTTTELLLWLNATGDGWIISASKKFDYDGSARTETSFNASLGGYGDLSNIENQGSNFISLTVDPTGTVTDWEFEIQKGIPNGSILFPENGHTRMGFGYTDQHTAISYAASYGGTGNGYWTRTGADEIFAAPVPLPATGLLLVGGLAGLAGARRARGSRQVGTSS